MNSSKLSDYLANVDFAELTAKAEAEQQHAQQVAAAEAQRAAEQAAKAKAQQTQQLTEQDVKNAHAEGYDKGLEAGRTQGKEQAEQLIQQHLASLIAHLSDTTQLREAYLDTFKTQLRERLNPAVDDLLADIITNHEQQLVDGMLNTVCDQLPDTPALNITVHPASQIYMSQIIGKLFAEQNITLSEDETLDPGQVIVSWHTGGVDLSLNHATDDLKAAAIKATEIDFDLPEITPEPTPTDTAKTPHNSPPPATDSPV